MKYLITMVFLTGCVGTPVKQKFPEAPPSLTERCNTLKTVPDTAQLSTVLDIVVDNYSSYHECSIKVDSWNYWYKKQKENYDHE